MLRVSIDTYLHQAFSTNPLKQGTVSTCEISHMLEGIH